MKIIDRILSPDGENEDQIETGTKDISKDVSNKTVLVEPRAFSEATQIADYLKNNNQVVVNFKRVTSDVSKRIMDFLNGIIYAIEGSMQKLGPGIILCAPKGCEIEGKISEEQEKKSGKSKITEDW